MEDKAEYACKHCSPYSGQCYIKSVSGTFAKFYTHINIACTGKCDKYKEKGGLNYDKT